MKRRQFISLSGKALATLYGMQFFDLNRNLAQAAVKRDKKMFIIFLRGGMDGLSVAPSVKNLEIITSRRGSMYDGAQYTSMVSQSGYQNILRIHKELSIVNSGGVAIFPHAGSMNSTKSHFEQMNFIEGGDASKVLGTGYLARAMSAENGLTSVVVGDTRPYSLNGADPLVVRSVANLESALLVRNMDTLIAPAINGEDFGVQERLRFMSSVDDGETCRAGDKYCISSKGAADSLKKAKISVNSDSPFELAAALSASTLSPQIITMDMGGWDIHSDGKNRMVELLKELNSSLTLLKNGLISRNLWDKSVVVVMSEFGRTINLNGAGGLDHGRGGLMFALGGKVQASTNTAFTNDWGFASGDMQEQGPSQCFAVKTDYRDVVANILIDHLGFSQAQVVGTAAGAVFPGHTSYRRPNIIRS